MSIKNVILAMLISNWIAIAITQAIILKQPVLACLISIHTSHC